MRVVEQVGDPGRQLRAGLVAEDAVGAVVDAGGWGDDVAAVAAGVDQLTEPAGGVAEVDVGRGAVVAVDAAGRGGHGVGVGERPVADQLGEHVLTGPAGRGGWLAGFGDVGVDDQQPGGSAGDADAVGAVRPGPADPAGVLGGALFPAGVAVAAPGVGPVAAGRRMGGAGGPFRAGHEGEDEPAVLRVVEGLPEQGGGGVAHRVTAASVSCGGPGRRSRRGRSARARPAAKTWVAAWSSRSRAWSTEVCGSRLSWTWGRSGRLPGRGRGGAAAPVPGRPGGPPARPGSG